MNCTLLLAILSLMPVAVDAQSVDAPSQIESKFQSSDTKQENSQQYVIAASVWEEINPKAGKVKRRVLCEPTLIVTEGRKAKFVSGGTIPARVADQSNDLPIGTKLNAVVVAKDADSVRIACDISVGVLLQSDDGEVRTYSQSFGIACDLKLGEEKTIEFDLNNRKLNLTLKVKPIDPLASK